MSGVEIIGLILGVLPLFISAAEHYRDGIGFAKKAMKKELFASQYRDEIAQQRTLLSLYIQAVVGRTSLSPTIQAELVSQPSNDVWQKKDVIKQISAELGSSYQRFSDILSRICLALSKQIKSDGADTLGEDRMIQCLKDLNLEAAQATSSQAKDKLWDRIKFSCNSSERASIILELQTCNNMLEKLSVATDRAKPYERKQQTRRVHAAFEYREEVGRLFTIMQSACRCQSSLPRNVGLRLQVCPNDDDGSPESKFQMIWIDSQDAICELYARITKFLPEQQPKKKKKLCFVAPAAPDMAASFASLTKNMQVLGDICKEVQKAHACKGCVELFVDEKEKVYCEATNNKSPTPQLQTSQELLSLTTVLSNLRLYDRKKWFHKEKAVLAIILAYSLLQLHESPWLRTQWNCDTIAFVDSGLCTRTGLTADAYFELRSPYARSQIAREGSVTRTRANISPPKPPRRNAHLHALGVMLLELYLNRSIEPEVTGSISKDYNIEAQRLLTEHADDIDMTPEYFNAIRFCLCPHPNPFSGSFSFDDKGFREIFYSEVIAKLEDNLTSRFEIADGFLDHLPLTS